MAVVLFYLCCFLALLKGTNSLATRQDIHNLRNQLLTNYDKNLSPNINQTEPVTLYVSFGLFTIQEFDDVKGKLSILGGFNISWNDDRIVWDPRMYGNITYISLAEADVWIPVAVLGRPYDDFKRLGHDFIRIFYTYNGNAFWDVADLFEISCSEDIAYYPFDRQMCEIFFVPFGYHPDFFSLKLPFDSMLYVNFTENGSWKLLSSSMSVDVVVGSGNVIRMILKFERRPLFIMTNILLPIIIVCSLNIFIFILPPEPGERSAFGTAILLSLAVFLSVVSDKLPSSSQPHIARITIYLLVQLIASSSTVAMAIIGLKIYKREADCPIPDWIQKLYSFFSRQNKIGGTKRNSTSSVFENGSAGNDHVCRQTESGYIIYTGNSEHHGQNNNLVIKQPDNDRTHDITLVRPFSRLSQSGEQTHTPHPNLTWNQVGRIYDRLCLVSFLIVNICIILVEVIDLVIYLNSDF